MEIVPPMLHMQVLESVSAGMLAIMVLLAPGVHGAAVAGTQGVGTPEAAEVRILQVPKGMMLAMGILSMMLAAGTLQPGTLLVGRTVSDEGAVPIVQVHIAPMTTSFGIMEKIS